MMCKSSGGRKPAIGTYATDRKGRQFIVIRAHRIIHRGERFLYRGALAIAQTDMRKGSREFFLIEFLSILPSYEADMVR